MLLLLRKYGAANSLVYHSGLYAASAALLRVAGFAFFLWLARTLSVEEYAAWGLLYALQTALSTFGLVGIVEAVVGLLKGGRSAGQLRQLFAAANSVFLLTLGVSIAVGLCLFAVLLKGEGISLLAVAGALASGSLLAFASLQAQLVRLEERHSASLVFNFAIPLAGLAGSFIAFFAENTVAAFFCGSTLGLAGSLLAARLAGIGFYSRVESMVARRSLLKRIAPFIPVAFLGWLGGYGNNYVIQLCFDSAQVARFTLAFMLASSLQLVATAMNQVWSPRFYRMIHEVPIEEVERQSRRFFRLQAIALGLAGGVLIALYPQAVRIVGGNLLSYGGLGRELVLLVSAYVVLVPWWHCANYLLAFDQGTGMMKVHTATSFAGIVVMVLCMLLMGPLGIYVGFLAQMALRSAGAFMLTRKQWAVRVSVDGIVAGITLALLSFVVSENGPWH